MTKPAKKPLIAANDPAVRANALNAAVADLYDRVRPYAGLLLLHDPHKVMRGGQNVDNELQKLEAADPSHPLLISPEYGVPMRVLILDRHDAVSEKVKVPVAEQKIDPRAGLDPEMTTQVRIADAASLRTRVVKIVESTRQEREVFKTLSERLLGGRDIANTRPWWETELTNLLSGIGHLEREGVAPKALVAMRPALQVSLDKLSKAIDLPPRRSKVWNPQITENTRMLQLVLADVYGWAAVYADDKLLRAIERVVKPLLLLAPQAAARRATNGGASNQDGESNAEAQSEKEAD